MKKPSQKQEQILDFITKKIKTDGYPPSIREIGAAVGLRSPSTVHMHIANLQKLGLIEKHDRKTRALKLGNVDLEPVLDIPILGTVTAGMPISAVEDIEGYVPIPESVVSNRELFALRIEGRSMSDVGIMDGDVVIVEKRATADNGEIVVALLEDSATVKRFFKENGHFRLQPENDDYAPIIVDEVAILGKVIMCIRTY